MKYIGLIILFCLLSFRVNAQNEVPADSVRSMNMPATKNFDGFLLDMNLMKNYMKFLQNTIKHITMQCLISTHRR